MEREIWWGRGWYLLEGLVIFLTDLGRSSAHPLPSLPPSWWKNLPAVGITMPADPQLQLQTLHNRFLSYKTQSSAARQTLPKVIEEVIVLNFASGPKILKTILTNNIIKMPEPGLKSKSKSNQSFKHNFTHRPSLKLTPNLHLKIFYTKKKCFYSLESLLLMKLAAWRTCFNYFS